MVSVVGNFWQLTRNMVPGSMILGAVLLLLHSDQLAILYSFLHDSPVIFIAIALLVAYIIGAPIGWASATIAVHLLYLQLFNDIHYFRLRRINKEEYARDETLVRSVVGRNNEVADYFIQEFEFNKLNYTEMYDVIEFCKREVERLSPAVSRRLERTENSIQIVFTSVLPLLFLTISIWFSRWMAPYLIFQITMSVAFFIWIGYTYQMYYERIYEARDILWAYYNCTHGSDDVAISGKSSH